MFTDKVIQTIAKSDKKLNILRLNNNVKVEPKFFYFNYLLFINISSLATSKTTIHLNKNKFYTLK
jgi:hypothetical protein